VECLGCGLRGCPRGGIVNPPPSSGFVLGHVHVLRHCSEAGSYVRLVDGCSTLRLTDLLGPLTRVKKKKKTASPDVAGFRGAHFLSRYRGTSLIRKRPPPWDPHKALGMSLR